MKILHSWLREFTDIGSDVDAVADALTKLGLAVEGVEMVGAAVAGVVVSRVVRTQSHPDAATVHRVFVDAGDGTERHVWCGAFNMSVGDLVPLATIGTVMPDGRVISSRGILGIDSEGMLCSSIELGLGSDTTGIFILPPNLQLGADIFESLGIEVDHVYDLDVTRNRPDCNGYLGVARDLAANFGKPLHVPPEDQKSLGVRKSVPVKIVDQERCARFNVTVMSGIKVCPSPNWVARRLTDAGMRPINNVVDASNFVTLELNQPNHAYDFDQVNGGFIIRSARDSETIVTLDGVTRLLHSSDLLICDSANVPVGIAGIMGGHNSQINPSTSTVALETAWFEPVGIAESVNRLALRTEASLRFERGVDPYGIDHSILRFAAILRESCPQLIVHLGAVDARTAALPPETSKVALRLNQIPRVLGVEISAAQVVKMLTPIGFLVADRRKSTVKISVPSYRPDCVDEIDIIEEVARHYGYDQLGKAVPKSPNHGRRSPLQMRRRLVRELLIAFGSSEAMPNPFLAPGDLARCGVSEDNALRVANPLVAEESVLRTSLRPGLLRAVALNQSHRASDISLFEIGHVYPQGSEILPDEHEALCVMVANSDAHVAIDLWSQISAGLGVGAQLDQDKPPAGFHATRSAELSRGRISIGAVGEIDPTVLANYGIVGRVACVELNLSILLADEPKIRVAQVVSKFPSSDFDLAFETPRSVAAAVLTKALRQAGGALVVDMSLFDIFRRAGVSPDSRSLAYRFRLQAVDRTLTDSEVAAVRLKCIAAAEKLGATLRGAA
ncbi:MAG: phenylalanine--tRNA ligase subunit beta [Ilumatobacteraceae bacterium]